MTSSFVKYLFLLFFSMPLLAQEVDNKAIDFSNDLWLDSPLPAQEQLQAENLGPDVIGSEIPDDDVSIVQKFEKNQPENEMQSSVSNNDATAGSHGFVPRVIDRIIVEGNKNVPYEAILNKIPYHFNDQFSPLKSRQAINNLMDMGYFSDVELKGELVGNDKINLHFIVTEKKLLKDVSFKGNKHLTEKDIKKKINFFEKPALDENDLKKYVIALQKLYREKNYHTVDIKAEIKNDEASDKGIAVFTIDENKKTQVQRVFFEGNKAFPDKQLRGLVFTREDWILGFMDRSGSYHPEALEADSHTLENFYQSNGFLNAKVTKVDVDPYPNDPTTLKVTFRIHEGDIYHIGEIKIVGDDTILKEQLATRLPIKVGDLYSREKIRDSIEALRLILGEYGYIYADIDPVPQPNDETKTVSLTFYIELGDKITVRKIQIRGNEKTRQKIIRRNLLIDEGDLLTSQKLEQSKYRIEQLGFFDQQNGVSWKIKRVNRDIADLELFLREVKTGRVDAQLGFGGSPRDLQNPTESLRIGGSISDTNLLGLGVGFNLSGEFSKQERQLLFNITEPWLFDKPIFASFDVALKKSVYEDFQFTKEEVKEQLANGSLSIGFIAQNFNLMKCIFQVGVEGLHYSTPPEVDTSMIPDPKAAEEFAVILRRRFPQGSFVWTAAQASQDCRNHPLHPSRGYQWLWQNRIGFPSRGEFHIATSPTASSLKVGFWKIDYDASYFTPLIGERDLIFYFHTHLGIVGNFSNTVIPYRELYHIGGPSSVRGFLFGEIGPTFMGVNSLGATKAFWFNTELIFPVAADFSIKGVLFYDGGAGWDTPNANIISPKRLINNHFNFRHSVGFGFRLLRPTPVRIDWGFKLDKRKGEKASQVHLTMSHDF